MLRNLDKMVSINQTGHMRKPLHLRQYISAETYLNKTLTLTRLMKEAYVATLTHCENSNDLNSCFRVNLVFVTGVILLQARQEAPPTQTSGSVQISRSDHQRQDTL